MQVVEITKCCLYCGNNFVLEHGNQLLCSSGCREKRGRQREHNFTKSGYRKSQRDARFKIDPIKQRTLHYRSRYGITYAAALALFNGQDCCCAICGKKVEFFHESIDKKVHVDHCHKTGKVRGILCNPCNKMLGNAKDSIETLKSAVRYLTSDD